MDRFYEQIRAAVDTDIGDDNPLVGLAEVHGTGFLTASAEFATREAGIVGDNGPGQAFEDHCMEAIGFLVLAIKARRNRDAAAILPKFRDPVVGGKADPGRIVDPDEVDFGQMRSGDRIATGIPGLYVELL